MALLVSFTLISVMPSGHAVSSSTMAATAPFSCACGKNLCPSTVAPFRQINKLLVKSVVETCQLQMGLTQLRNGSIWNTMPPHTHDRRSEVYFYFDVKKDNVICHFMGQPQETRHVWLKNEQAVISPAWSIHAGAGTCDYSFIWGMAGENFDYSDMDQVENIALR